MCGITLGEMTQTFNNALKELPEITDYFIDTIETIRIKNNGFYEIRFYCCDGNGKVYSITKCLRPKNWRPPENEI